MSELKNIDSFISAQLAEWPMASANFEALKGVEVKEIPLEGWTIKVQFNPARIVSSAAKVDKASLAARKCFLCEANRPDVQRGIDWNIYEVLINPFPIFPRHLTIPDKRHTDQLIAGRIADMIKLAGELGEYTVFYNGPKCGASAPDHMHFQAGNSDFLTLGAALEDAEQKEIAAIGDSRLSLVTSLPLNVFVIDAANAEDGQKLFDKVYAALPVPEGEKEPMMNLLCYSTPAGVRLVVIPRKKHRPSFYGTEGEGCMLISPASVDMSGVFITPRREDFDKIDSQIISKIFEELCLSNDEILAVAEKIEK